MKRGSVAPQFRTAHEIGSRAERDEEDERGKDDWKDDGNVPARGMVNIETNVDFDRKRTRNWRKR